MTFVFRNLWTWTAVMLAGVAILAAIPVLPSGVGPAGSGVFPEWLTPVGYFVTAIGAAGMFAAWVLRKG